MNVLNSFSLGFLLVLLAFPTLAYLEEISIDDLLIPETPLLNEKSDDNQLLVEKPKEQITLDELLGPKDIFPFLPDNHRDSGTGKFNGF